MIDLAFRSQNVALPFSAYGLGDVLIRALPSAEEVARIRKELLALLPDLGLLFLKNQERNLVDVAPIDDSLGEGASFYRAKRATKLWHYSHLLSENPEIAGDAFFSGQFAALSRALTDLGTLSVLPRLLFQKKQTALLIVGSLLTRENKRLLKALSEQVGMGRGRRIHDEVMAQRASLVEKGGAPEVAFFSGAGDAEPGDEVRPLEALHALALPRPVEAGLRRFVGLLTELGVPDLTSEQEGLLSLEVDPYAVSVAEALLLRMPARALQKGLSRRHCVRGYRPLLKWHAEFSLFAQIVGRLLVSIEDTERVVWSKARRQMRRVLGESAAVLADQRVARSKKEELLLCLLLLIEKGHREEAPEILQARIEKNKAKVLHQLWALRGAQ